uniref:Uncharacterized protein n=1 Tax=Cyprinodon variegatus TaxID=28743 RepID=A0A3Q2CPM0_CYPVA
MSQCRTAVQDFRVLVGLTVLLGLTWSVGFLSFGPGRGVVLCLFAILNSFQGFFVFLFHCLMKENVRKQWRIYLCCGRFRVIESLGMLISTFSTPHPCLTCCMVTGENLEQALPLALSRTLYQAGASPQGLGSLWTLLLSLNLVIKII